MTDAGCAKGCQRLYRRPNTVGCCGLPNMLLQSASDLVATHLPTISVRVALPPLLLPKTHKQKPYASTTLSYSACTL